MNREDSLKSRTLYLDILRIAATLFVVFFHQTGVAENPNIPWSENFSIACQGITRWIVPIFVMISGALFLDNSKPLSIKKLYTKNIFRIVTAFLFWAVVYAVYHYSTPVFFIEGVIMGRYHMWFLFMILGLYIMTPLLRKITSDKKATEYFLIVSAVFGIGIATFNMTPLADIAPGVSGYVFDNLNLGILAGYSFFFVLGYYLNKFGFGKKTTISLIMLGVLGCVVSIVLKILCKNVENGPNYYNHFFLPITLECISVFLIGKCYLSKIKFSEIITKIILLLSKYSFGVYLVHDLILTMIRPWIISTFGQYPPVAILMATIVTFLISLAISAALNNIPFLKRYIV